MITEKYVSSAGAGAHDGTSEADAYSWAEAVAAIVAAGAGGSAGNRYNCKADATYTRTTTTDTISGGGTSTAPLIFRGYNSTIGDGYLGRDTVGALITTNMPLLSYTTGRPDITATWVIWETMNLTSARSGSAIGFGADTLAVRSVCTNSSTNAAAFTFGLNTRGILFDCDVLMTGASGGIGGLSLVTVAAKIFCCRFSAVSVIPCITMTSAAPVIAFNTFHSSGQAIATTNTAAAPAIFNNTIVSNSGNGIDILTGTTGLQCIWGNMITDNGAFGIDLNNAAVAAFIAYNRTRDNTSGAIDPATDWATATLYGQVTTDTGAATTDYVDPSNDNYNLIAASPGTSASLPASASMGALQRSQTGSGGGQRSFQF